MHVVENPTEIIDISNIFMRELFDGKSSMSNKMILMIVVVCMRKSLEIEIEIVSCVG